MPDDLRFKGTNYFTNDDSAIAIPSVLALHKPGNNNNYVVNLSDATFQVDGVSPFAVVITRYSFYLMSGENLIYDWFGDSSDGYNHQAVIQRGQTNIYELPSVIKNSDFTYKFDSYSFQKDSDEGDASDRRIIYKGTTNFLKDGGVQPKLIDPTDRIYINNGSAGVGNNVGITHRFSYIAYFKSSDAKIINST